MIPPNASSLPPYHGGATCTVELGVVDFRSDREARNQLVSYVKSESVCAFVFLSSLAVDGGLVGNLGGKHHPKLPNRLPSTAP